LLVAALFQLAQRTNDYRAEALLPQDLRLMPECSCMRGTGSIEAYKAATHAFQTNNQSDLCAGRQRATGCSTWLMSMLSWTQASLQQVRVDQQ